MVRAQVQRIAVSRRFVRSSNMKRLLAYLADETLAGRAENLKALAIGREALGRGSAFDPQLDPIVRVEAARLRRLLDEYAADEGIGDPIRISLPSGAYALRFEAAMAPSGDAVGEAEPDRAQNVDTGSDGPPPTEQEASRAQDRPARSPAASLLRRGKAGAAALGLILSVLAAATLFRPAPAPSPAPAPPAGADSGGVGRIAPPERVVKVRPFEVPANDTLSAALAIEAETRLRDALARFDGLTVMASGKPRPVADPLLPQLAVDSRTPPQGPDPDYAIEGAMARDAFGRHRFEGRLVDLRRGVIVSSRLVEEPFHTAPELSPDWLIDVIRDMASRLASPYGVLHAHERRQNPAGDPMTDRRACHRLTFDLWRSFQADVEGGAIACLEAAVQSDPSDSLSLSLLAYNEAVALRERRLFGGQRPDSTRMLTRAQSALDLAPTSAGALQAVFGAHKVRGESSLAISAGRRALRANPYDLDLMADVGAFLVMQGQVDEGRGLVDAALRTNANPPQWVWGVMALAALIDHDEPRMLAAVARSHGMGYALNGLMHLVVMSRQGRALEAQRFQEELMRRYPEFEGNVRDALLQLTLGERVIDRLLPEVGWLRVQ
jgi:adenylate cyclase